MGRERSTWNPCSFPQAKSCFALAFATGYDVNILHRIRHHYEMFQMNFKLVKVISLPYQSGAYKYLQRFSEWLGSSRKTIGINLLLATSIVRSVRNLACNVWWHDANQKDYLWSTFLTVPTSWCHSESSKAKYRKISSVFDHCETHTNARLLRFHIWTALDLGKSLLNYTELPRDIVETRVFSPSALKTYWWQWPIHWLAQNMSSCTVSIDYLWGRKRVQTEFSKYSTLLLNNILITVHRGSFKNLLSLGTKEKFP